MRWWKLSRSWELLTLSFLVGLGCERTPEPKPAPAPAPAVSVAATPAVSVASGPSPTSSARPEPAAAVAAENHRLPSSRRVVAIGDVHGDLQALRAALRLAGAIDGDDAWIGGKDLTIVQTGDQLDRGDQDREVLDVLERLEDKAKAAGSALHVLNGNHELMQASFDFRYVTRRSLESFRDFSAAGATVPADVPPEARGRAAAFAPGAPYAQKLARHLTVALVGDNLFAHGGVLPAHVDYGLSRINTEATNYLAGKRADLPRILAAEDSPVWTREYGEPVVSAATCDKLARVLAQAGAKRLIVGHTVQKNGVNGACQDRLFRIDVGLSAYYGANPVQVLEITASGTRILTASAGGKERGAPRESAVQSPP